MLYASELGHLQQKEYEVVENIVVPVIQELPGVKDRGTNQSLLDQIAETRSAPWRGRSCFVIWLPADLLLSHLKSVQLMGSETLLLFPIVASARFEYLSVTDFSYGRASAEMVVNNVGEVI